MPPEPSTPPTDAPDDAPDGDAAGAVDYLREVMAEIDDEVRRRRASGDLPPGLERELDELFLEFSPVGLQGRARLRETLHLLDSAAHVDVAVPVASQKAVGTYVKRAIRSGLGWYLGFIVHQIVQFFWATSRMFHALVDRVEELEADLATVTPPDLPVGTLPPVPAGERWWTADAVSALAGADGRVLVAECGDGALVAALVAAGVDAYGVDPGEADLESALDRGLDVRAESALDHLEVVADEALAGLVLTGSVQWLHPTERARLLERVTSRLAVDGVLVLHSATPAAWAAASSPVLADLAPGRPLHAETWSHLLGAAGYRVTGVAEGGGDRRLAPVAGSSEEAAAVNAALEVVNRLLLGPAEYVVTAVRER